MTTKTYALYKPGGRVVRGYSYGELTEVRYLDVVPIGIESPDRDEFIQLVEQAQLTEEDLRECRIGYVDDKGIGNNMAGKNSWIWPQKPAKFANY